MIAFFVWSILYSRNFKGLVEDTREFRLRRKEWQFPSRILSDYREYRLGDRVDLSRLADELRFRDYPATALRIDDVGVLMLATGKRTYPDGFQQVDNIRVHLGSRNEITKIEGEGKTFDSFRLQPIHIGYFVDHHLILRKYCTLEEISLDFKRAVVSAEDRHFYNHMGINPLSMFRASQRNMTEGAIVQGGSTITQQVVKNLYLSNKRTYSRKLREAIGSLYLESTLEKDEILEWYVNLVYFGYDFPYNICGIYEASRHYFGKTPDLLTLPEAALLAGIIPAPSYFDPFNHPERAKRRRNHILNSMHEDGHISDSLFNWAKESPVLLKNVPPPKSRYRYFREAVQRFAHDEFSDSTLYFNGGDVYTSLSPYLQQKAQGAIQKGVAHIDSLWFTDNAQGALVVIDNSDFRLKAIVGGRNDEEDLFNRALQAYRQPGSSFKTFVYLAAMDAPLSEDSMFISPSTLLPDTPSVFIVTDSLDSIWKPKNYGGEYLGITTVRRAIERSQNIATSYLTMMLTPERIAEYAYKTGISSDIGIKPSLGLGASEVTPYEITRAMTTIANYGRRGKVTPIRYITDKDNDIYFRPDRGSIQEIDSTSSFLLIHLLDGVVRFGRSYDVRKLGFLYPSCGKTGTSNDSRDTWYVGFTRQYSTGVWMGYDDARPFGLTGTQAAIPVWTDFNISAHLGEPALNFHPPSGLSEIWVCHHSGMLPTAHCPLQTREYFLPGTEPQKPCNWHIEELIDSTGIYIGREHHEEPDSI